jgi:hypothetical protein
MINVNDDISRRVLGRPKESAFKGINGRLLGKCRAE